MKFIHAADLHIDSPLRGLEAYEGAPVDRIRNATRESLENLVTLAVAEQVDFVIVAGDLFDGKWRDMATGLWTAQQFRRLDRENIPVYLIRGNHDAASEVRQAVSWPDNVREFAVDKPQTFVDEKCGVALHGQGFARREVLDDLSAKYPKPNRDLFNIGVLHTSLTGDSQHDTYAPTSVENLLQRGYDYWALGHIHDRRAIRNEHPFVHFSGNTQGRHINEPGAKGCLLVTVDNGSASVEFHATDAVRWQHLKIMLQPEDARDDLLDVVRTRLEDVARSAQGRMSALRLTIQGKCQAHNALANTRTAVETSAEIRNIANEFDGEIWIEKIRFDTSAPVDIERLRQGSDLMGDLLRLCDFYQDGDDELLELAGELKCLSDRAGAELELAGINLNDPDNIRQWMQQAQGLLVSKLWEQA